MKRLGCLVLALALLLCGCRQADGPTEMTVFAMDTVMDLKLWGPDAQQAAQKIQVLLQELEATWSVTDEDSLLSRLNRGQGTPDPRQQALLDLALEYKALTGGAFDPQLSAVADLWGFRSKAYAVPDAARIREALQTRQWDLGGILKGYAGNEAVSLLKALKIDRAILNLGGNVQTYGQKPDGSPWIIAIENPRGGQPVGQLAVSGTMAVVTSGNYQRYFEQDGKRYHHILDPETGYPAESGLASVTVVCSDAAKADALSTALFVMGLEEAAAFWRSHRDFQAVFVTLDGGIRVTADACFSGSPCEVIPYEN